MMARFFSRLACLLVLGLASLTAAVQAQQGAGRIDVEGTYLQGYMLWQEAEELEARRQYAAAYFKYVEANQIFDSIAQTHPNWQTGMVNYRRSLIRRKAEEVRQLERQRRSGGEESAAAGPQELLPPVDRTPTPPPAPSALSVPSALPPVPGVQTGTPLDRKLTEMQSQLSAYAAENKRLQESMQAKEAELFKTKQDFLSNKQELNAALQKQLDLQGRLDTADQRRNRELGELRKQLEETNAALKKATEAQEEATQRIDSLLQDLSTARQTIAQLNGEKEALLAERTQMLALIKGGEGGLTAEALLEENARLKRQLDEANQKVATLTTDRDAAQKEAGALREQMAALKDELDRTRKENEDYRQQIAALRDKLEATNEHLLATGGSLKDDSELAEENRLLRKMILDQLKHQNFREQKKRLALEQLARLQINNEELLAAINDLAAPPPTLSGEEQGLLQHPQMEEYVEGAGVGATMLARPEGEAAPGEAPPSGSSLARGRQDLEPALQSVAEAGINAFREGKAWEAERAFVTILKDDPTNVFALSNAAVAQVRQAKFAEAEKNLKKALAYHESDAFSHYLLGVLAYRQKKLEEAERCLQISLGLDPANARAHFTLGCVHNKQGAMEAALKEFQEAVAVEPDYADAHYNLAVIYANQQDLTKAADHYAKAVEHGSERDPQLEEVLGLPVGAR